MSMTQSALACLVLLSLCSHPALGGESEPGFDGVEVTGEARPEGGSRPVVSNALARQLSSALPRAGIDDPQAIARIRDAILAFTTAFEANPRVRSGGWRLVRITDVDGFGASIRLRGQSVVIADFPLACELVADVREGRIVGLPYIHLVLAAEDVSGDDARVWYCAPGSSVTLPVDPEASRKWLAEELAAAGFTSVETDGDSTHVQCRTPGGPTGLLAIDATASKQVWTAGSISAVDGAIQYRQRIVLYEGNVPRHVRGIIEGKVDEAITDRFKDAVARICAQVPGQFAFSVTAATLVRGKIVVDGLGAGESARREQSSFGRDFTRDRSAPDFGK